VQAHLLVDKASLSKIRKLVRADLVKVGAEPSVIFDCMIAVTEACARALHGRNDRAGEPSKITWVVSRDRAEFCVEDFSPLIQTKGPHPKRRIHEVIEEETGIKGLGESVIRKLMDDVELAETEVSRSMKLTKRL
jgi:anti-sigma regulatory factor (Ser/Thr protein kinase)